MVPQFVAGIPPVIFEKHADVLWAWVLRVRYFAVNIALVNVFVRLVYPNVDAQLGDPCAVMDGIGSTVIFVAVGMASFVMISGSLVPTAMGDM